MAKQTKPKSKRTQIKDLNLAQQELTTEEASKVKGGGIVFVGGWGSSMYGATQPPKISLSSPTTKK